VRAVVCNELGPPSLLRVEECPDPVPGPHHVVVDVEAAGVNYVDALFVAGQYQIKPPVPFVPGTESAGRVAALGESVDDLEVGTRVLVSAGLGGFATKVAAPVAAVTVLPDVLDAPRAATFTQSYSTCLFALRARAQVEPGESVLVLGAGGGVGLAAIGVARALGCRVLGVASSEEKRAAALAAGAEAALDPAAEPVKDAARAWAGGTGVDVVVDPVAACAGRPRPLPGHRLRGGNDPLHPLEPGPVAQPDGDRHRLGHLGHATRRGAARPAGRPSGHGGRREDRAGPPDGIPARRRGASTRGPAGPAYRGKDRAHPLATAAQPCTGAGG
jgi:threonine dehydrogenase-like Zn-dependent dehydrogenase